MIARQVSFAAAALLFAVSGLSFAQSTYNAGGSKRCEALSGAERQQCLNDEGAKTDKGVGTPQSGSAGAGASEDRATNFERRNGDSPHCDTMSGPQKEQCLRDEAAKTDRGVGTPPSSAK
jgi:hypothetical protein